MSRFKKGFTLIEVALFLVITGALFAAVTVGVQNSISQQRFNDAVQNFAEFLRNVYSETMNVQSIGTGRTDKAIYGRLITFGENSSAAYSEGDGNAINQNDTRNVIYVYDVIGDIGDIGTGDALEALDTLNADVIRVEGDEIRAVGIIENYSPKWGAQIEPACNETTNECDYDPFKGAVLIIRHPRSGTVYTYVMENETIEVNQYIGTAKSIYNEAWTTYNNEGATEEERLNAQHIIENYVAGHQADNILKAYIKKGDGGVRKFQKGQIDFCVNPEGSIVYTMRKDVRIIDGARNASGIELINDDESKCRLQD